MFILLKCISNNKYEYTVLIINMLFVTIVISFFHLFRVPVPVKNHIYCLSNKVSITVYVINVLLYFVIRFN